MSTTPLLTDQPPDSDRAPRSDRAPKGKRGCLKPLALGLVAVLVLLFLFRGPILRGPGLNLGIWAAQRYAGLEIQASRLETSGWSFLRLEELAATPLTSDNSLRRLSAKSVEARFSLPDLLRGRVQGLTSLQVQDLDLEVDLTVSEPDPDAPPPKPLPNHLPVLNVEGLRLSLVPSEGRAVSILGDSLKVESTAEGEGDGERILVSLPQVEIEAPETRDLAFPVDGSLLYRAGLVSVTSLEAGSLSVAAGSFVDLTALAENRIAARLEAQSPSGEFLVEGSLNQEVAETAFQVESFELASLPRILSDPGLAGLDGALNLQGQTSLSLDDPLGGSGKIDARIGAPAFAGRRFDSAALTGVWAEGILAVNSLEVDQGANQVRITARDLPLKDITLESWLARAEGSLGVHLEDLPALLAAEGVELPELRGQMPQEIPEHQLTLQGRLQGGALEIEEGALTVADGSLQVQQGRLKILTERGGATTGAPALELDLDLTTDFPDLTSVGSVLGAPGAWGGSLRGEIHVAGVLPALSGDATLQGDRLIAGGVRLGRFNLDASLAEALLRLRTFRAQAPWGTLDVTGGVALASKSLETVEIDATIQDATLLATEAANLPDIVGNYRLTAQLDGPLDRLRGDLELRGSGGLSEGPIFDSIELDGQAANGLWQLKRLFAEGSLGRFDAAGQLETQPGTNPLGGATGTITELSWRRDGEQLALQEPTNFELQGGQEPQGLDLLGLELRDLELRGSVGGVTVNLQRASGETTLRALLEDVEPEAFVGYLLPEGLSLGGLSGTVDLVSGKAGLLVEASGNLDRLESEKLGEALSLDWQGRLSENHLSLEKLIARRGSEEILEIRGEAPLAPLGPELLPSGAVAFEGTIRPFRLEDLEVGPSGTLVSARLDGDFTLGGEWASLEGDVRFRGEDLTLDLANVPALLRDGVATAQVHLGTRGEGLRFDKITMSFPERLTAEASGSIPWDGDVATLVKNAETLTTAPLDFRVEGSLEEVRWLRPFLPEVRRLEGSARADLRIGGTVESPRPEGTLHLEDIALRLEEGGFSLEDLDGRVEIEDRRFELADVTGKLGAEPFELTGTVDLGEGAAGVDLSLTGNNLLLVRDPSLRLRSDVDLRVTGPMEALVIRGSLGLRNSRLTQEIDLLGIAAGSVTGTLAGTSAPTVDTGGLQLFSFPDPPLAQARLDLAITTQEPLQLASNLASGSLRLDLQLRGTGEVPLPSGLIYLEPTKVRLPSGTLQFDSGTIRFQQENPFSPTLALNGAARLKGYDVDIGVTGDLDEPEVLLSSTPPLPNDELLLLVLTGQLPATGASSGLRDKQAAEAVVLYLARDFLTRWLSKGGDPEDSSWVDRFEIVRGRDVSENGVETTEASFRVLGGEDLPGDLRTLYLVAEQDSFEDYNYGLRFVFRFQ